jgi:hypothetical protein
MPNPKSQTRTADLHPVNNVLRLRTDHPLVGTWVVAHEASNIEFTISARPKSFAVRARDSSDGELYVVENVNWDGQALSFKLLVPSNGTRVQHRMRTNRDGTLEDVFTASYVDVLVRRTPQSQE